MKNNLGGRYRLMIALLAFTAYLPTLGTGFLWDDHVTVEANASLRTWSLENLKHDFSTDVFDGQGDPYYRPLATLISRMDYSVWGLRPAGYHLTNLLFHLGNALLIAELILALGFPLLTAFLAGSLFAVHPIGVEQLMIVSGRAELMGLFFTLSTLLLLLRKTPRAIAFGYFSFIAAVMSKESGVVAPALLALVYYVRKEQKQTYYRIIPMLLLLPFYFVLRQAIVGPLLPRVEAWLTLRFFLQEFPAVLFRYTALILAPWNLHSHRALPHISSAWLVYLFALLSLVAYLIQHYRRTALFCIGWLLICLLPKTPVMIHGGFMLDHWMYPAALAIFLPLAMAVNAGWTSTQNNRRWLAAIGYFGFIIITALLVHLNVALRGSDEKMYRWALNFTRSNPIKYNLGILMIQQGRPKEAIPLLSDMLVYYPENPEAVRALSFAYWAAGYPRAGLMLLENFLKRYPNNPPCVAQLQEMKQRIKRFPPSK